MLAAVAALAGVVAGATGDLMFFASQLEVEFRESWSDPGGLAIAVAAGLAVAPVLAVLGVTKDPFPAAPFRRGKGAGLVLLRVMTVMAAVLLTAFAVAYLVSRLTEDSATLALVSFGVGAVAGLLVLRLLWKIPAPTQRRGEATRQNRRSGRALFRGLATGLFAGICLGAAFGLAQGTTLALRASQNEFPADAVLHERSDGTRYATTADGWLLGRFPNGDKYVRTPGPVHGVVIQEPGDEPYVAPGSLAEVSKWADCGAHGTQCTPFYGPVEIHQGIHTITMVKLPSGAFVGDDWTPSCLRYWLAIVTPERLFTKATAFGLQAGFGLGVISSVAAGLFYWLVSTADTARTSSPLASLRADRAAVVARGLSLMVLGTGISLLLLVGGLVADDRQLPGLSALVFVWAPVGPLTIGLSAWGWLLPTRLWLCATGRLPWRLMAFLDDAHRRGVLRQAGAVYQFRHARLQEQLATNPGTPGSSLTT